MHVRVCCTHYVNHAKHRYPGWLTQGISSASVLFTGSHYSGSYMSARETSSPELQYTMIHADCREPFLYHSIMESLALILIANHASDIGLSAATEQKGC